MKKIFYISPSIIFTIFSKLNSCMLITYKNIIKLKIYKFLNLNKIKIIIFRSY
ncbi:hypothetical protein CURT_1688 [Campylobacter ureolyticus]|uniref:Uncharacterized protein n=1 Tax=Campylobacter ureolyticus TaxID=827 RepID=A0AAE7EBH3_9BACT|nr:hypothetical protein CURT_1688 [Campylobacter ureolyticus]